MNNIRQIITERLENARNDYQRCLEDIDYPLCMADEFAGTIIAYQDCLNLFPTPRTEQEILKDFEALGYVVARNDWEKLVLNKFDEVIKIDKIDKWYKKFLAYSGGISEIITMQEHKLLNELFEVWGWL